MSILCFTANHLIARSYYTFIIHYIYPELFLFAAAIAVFQSVLYPFAVKRQMLNSLVSFSIGFWLRV